MARKVRVGILFGGKSAEHEVSLRSARNVAEALDKKKYEVVCIGVDTSGRWLPPAQSQKLLASASTIPSERNRVSLALAPQSEGAMPDTHIDVVFPVLHGPFGEDGTVQGLLKLANVPFVGPDVLGSAVGMDKDVMKRLLREADIPIGKFLVATRTSPASFEVAKKKLGLPLFIKPANLGSSVGVSKARTKREFDTAIQHALEFDTKILIEEYIDGREIECAVLGNEHPIASLPGELIVHHDFYSYDAKYLDDTGATPEIPAKIPARTAKQIQTLAIKTFKVLCCEGMGRVDFFVTKRGKIYVNEINTIPGFTSISMYPKLWEASGISYSRLIDTLITLAIERFKKQQKLRVTR